METDRSGRTATLLATLERLLEGPAVDLRTALAHASDLAAGALGAQKVDAFVYDAPRDTLVAVGSSAQPLSALQKKHGLDVLPLANGGRIAQVFRTGEPFLTGATDSDDDDLRGIREILGVRSTLAVPLVVGGAVRGVLAAASREADAWTSEDVRFAESVARWVGVVAHRAELVEEIARNAAEQGRRAAAEELVTVLAHDLRNHVSPIQLRLALVQRRSKREGRSEDARDIDIALRSVGRLAALITDILDVARIDRGVFELHPEVVDLVALARECATALSPAENPIQVRAPEDVVVSADPRRVRQCLENLLANAIRHAPQHGAVAVDVVREVREQGEWARLTVVDEGPGIAPELLPRLFDRFVTGSEGGLGLGLYLAKRIAAAHGGDLTVESAPGKGARFSLTLPFPR